MNKVLLYEYIVKFTSVVHYGVGLDAAMTGKDLPLEGIRVDVGFEGPITGAKVKGTVKGTDFLFVRGDRRMNLHIHGAVETDDGARISLFADGVALPKEGPVLFLKENVTLFTNDPRYSYLNTLQIWADGTVDLEKGEVQLKGYQA